MISYTSQSVDYIWIAGAAIDFRFPAKHYAASVDSLIIKPQNMIYNRRIGPV